MNVLKGAFDGGSATARTEWWRSVHDPSTDIPLYPPGLQELLEDRLSEQ